MNGISAVKNPNGTPAAPSRTVPFILRTDPPTGVASYLAAQGLDVTPDGPWHHANCPFHDDTRAQLRVFNQGIWACLDPTCKTGGDLAKLKTFFATGISPSSKLSTIDNVAQRMARERRPEPVLAHEFLTKELPPYGWLIENLLPSIGLTSLLGYFKVGKSLVALQLGLSISRGLAFMGRATPTERYPVLFLEEEGSESGLQKRMNGMADFFGIHGYQPDFYTWIRPGLRLDDEEDLNALRAQVEMTGAKLAIVGTMAASTSLDENNNPAIAEFAYRLNSLAHELGIAILLPHHMRKPDDRRGLPTTVHEVMNMSRGASSLIGATEANIALIRHFEDPIGKMYLLPREGSAQILRYEFNLDTLLIHPTDKQPNQRVSPEDAVLLALRVAGPDCRTTDLAVALNASGDTVSRRLVVLEKDALVERSTGPSNVHLWTLTEAGEEMLDALAGDAA